jgi:hypothetical protein
MTETPPISVDERRVAAASYIADLTGGLALEARRHGLNTLSYLLDMAKLEAENVKNGHSP